MTDLQHETYELTHLSVTDFYLMDKEWQKKIRFYTEETGKSVSDWKNLQASDECILSNSFICIQAFNNDHIKAAQCWKDTTIIAEQASKLFLKENLCDKVGSPLSPTVPEGWTYPAYKAAIFKRSEQVYLQIFAERFNQHLEVWLDKNGIF